MFEISVMIQDATFAGLAAYVPLLCIPSLTAHIKYLYSIVIFPLTINHSLYDKNI